MPEWPKKILPAIFDFPFKDLFGWEPMLASFAGATLGEPDSRFKGMVIADPNLNPRHKGAKHTIPDVRAKVPGRIRAKIPGLHMAVEMQRLYTPQVPARELFRLGRMMTEGVKVRQGYMVMPRVALILIAADFLVHPEDDKYHHRCRIIDEATGKPFPNSPELHTLELLKLPRKCDGTLLWWWMKLLSAQTLEEFEALARKGGVMAEAVARLRAFSANEKERLRAEARERFLMDQVTLRDMGRAEGEAKGRADERLAVARNMLKSKMPVADIAKFTGLSSAEVERLATRK